jgi:hypothetical protein
VSAVSRRFSLQLAGKKDVATGPAAGAAAGLGLWATFQHYITAHPYVAVGAAVGAGVAIWALIHWIKNRA